MQKKLCQLDRSLKNLLLMFVLTLTIGVFIGIVYLGETTHLSPSGTIERWNGSQVEQDSNFDIPSQYAKSHSEMLMTTHNHILSFSLIFIAIGSLFYFNSTIVGFWRNFLMLEPFISTVVTFTSIWAMRFIDENFVIVILISAILLYCSYFIMAGVCIYDLTFRKD